MRILALDLGTRWRGGQMQTALVAEALAARGHDVTLVAASDSPLARKMSRTVGIRLTAASGRGEASPRLLSAVRLAARRLRPDVIWASDGRGHGAAVWSLAAARSPLVVHRRVAFPPRTDPLSRLKYRAARRYVAISGEVARVLSGAGVPSDRIAVIPDGLPDAAFIREPALPAPPFRLVHAGAFDGMKGQEVAIATLARLVADGLDATLALLGDGSRRPDMERLAEASGVRVRCTFAGDVPDVAPRLARSHLLLLPSKSEGASLVLVEAMAAGCPVLVHDLPSVREVCEDGVSGRLVATLDPEAWADAAGRLLRDEPGRQRLVTAGRETAASRTLAASVARLEDVLEAA